MGIVSRRGVPRKAAGAAPGSPTARWPAGTCGAAWCRVPGRAPRRACCAAGAVVPRSVRAGNWLCSVKFDVAPVLAGAVWGPVLSCALWRLSSTRFWADMGRPRLQGSRDGQGRGRFGCKWVTGREKRSWGRGQRCGRQPSDPYNFPLTVRFSGAAERQRGGVRCKRWSGGAVMGVQTEQGDALPVGGVLRDESEDRGVVCGAAPSQMSREAIQTNGERSKKHRGERGRRPRTP
jgi:hypothetical protein